MNNQAKESAHQQIMNSVDETTVPSRMTPEEAYKFLDMLCDDIRVRMESLMEENPDLKFDGVSV